MVIFQTFHQSHPKSLAHPGSKRQERGPTGVRLDSPKVIVGWFAKGPIKGPTLWAGIPVLNMFPSVKFCYDWYKVSMVGNIDP